MILSTWGNKFLDPISRCVTDGTGDFLRILSEIEALYSLDDNDD